MNYSQQKSLYESIMKEVAETIKKSLNEKFESSVAKSLYQKIKEVSTKNPDVTFKLAVTQKMNELCIMFVKNGKYSKGKKKVVPLDILKDDSFEGEFLYGEKADKVMHTREYLDVYTLSLQNLDTEEYIFCVKLSESGHDLINHTTQNMAQRQIKHKDYTEDDFLVAKERFRNKKKQELRDKKELVNEFKELFGVDAGDISNSMKDLVSKIAYSLGSQKFDATKKQALINKIALTIKDFCS